jgi:hypothetical protein
LPFSATGIPQLVAFLPERSRLFAPEVKRNPLREYSSSRSIDRQALLANLGLEHNSNARKEVIASMVIKKTDPICLVSMVVKQG